jgi:thiol-disulfide isomerase/thioredoxin
MASDGVDARGGIRLALAPADADALSTIRTERLRAKNDGRVLVVYVSASWCEPCKRMKEEIHAGRLDAKLPRITLLSFDADRDQDRLASAGYTFSYIPYVALPGPDGHPLEQAEAKGKGAGAWKELVGTLESWQSR